MEKIVIIGGGASGLVTAIKASNPNNHILILEKNSHCGKKILITGNGRCNYFNENFTINNYHSNNLDILSQIITPHNKEQILSFWNSLGIIPKIKNGYYYPTSNQAITIQNALLLECQLKGIEIKNNYEVKDIKYKDNKFIIKTNIEDITADKIVLATGSKAAPQTGSDGIGYDIASNFGHNIIKPLPALVQLRTQEKYLNSWNGIRTDVKVEHYENNIKIEEEIGEIQLTDYGVSGICIFQLSSNIAKGLNRKYKEEIVIDFIPWLSTPSLKDFIEFMTNHNQTVQNRTIKELLEGMLNYKLVNIILNKSHINTHNNWNKLSPKEKNNLYENLKHFKINITETNSFNKAQVCSGGIPLSEININTMESLKQKNLYIVGELLDVDGKCGGYNLGFAWLSGIIAGNSLGGSNDKNKTN